MEANGVTRVRGSKEGKGEEMMKRNRNFDRANGKYKQFGKTVVQNVWNRVIGVKRAQIIFQYEILCVCLYT